MKTSWKTTLGGAMAALGTFLWGVPASLAAFKSDLIPDEAARWCILLGIVFSGLGVLFNGLFGRDNNVSSEQAGAKPKTEP